MNKSLEALDKLCKVKIYQKEASAYDYLGKEIYKEEINTIKQDLERLEELEKENLELKGLQELNKQGLWNLKQENQKLEKAIEILQEKRINIDYLLNSSECPTYNFYADDFSDLTQQEYELLKEVLEDDK